MSLDAVDDLLTDGLFRDIAVAYYPGAYRPTSIALAAKKLGATDKEVLVPVTMVSVPPHKSITRAEPIMSSKWRCCEH